MIQFGASTAFIEFRKFFAVGALGFVVDSLVLSFAIAGGASLLLGRAISFLSAATFTWALNRNWTFQKSAHAAHAEWAAFLAANAFGGVINYATYAALVTESRIFASLPVLGVAAGSFAGLLINFTLSRKFVFRRAR